MKMAATKIKQAKSKCRECDCWSLNYGKKRYKTFIHTSAKRTEDKTNQNDNIQKKIKNKKKKY